MTWSLHKKGEFLEPLKFSNGKTQEDIVKEVLDSIDKGNKIIFIHGMCGTGKCLDKDSLIFCKPQRENFFSYYKISEIVGKTGKIISKDKFGNLIESDFMNVRKTGKKGLYKLKTRTGREIILSKNHPLLTITKEGLEWKPLEELDETSYICLSNKIDVNLEEDYNEEKIKILAHLIAEGKLGDKAGSPVYFQCPNQNPLIRKDYIDALKKIFPEGEIKSYYGKDVLVIFRKMNTTKGVTNKLRLLIKEHGLDGKKSSEKFVPRIIFGLKKEKVAIFLSRLFSCDGCIYSREKQTVIEYCSISKRLIQDISILLQFFGIQHTIASKKFRKNKNYSWRICISNQNSLKKYIEQIGFIGRKQKKALKILKKLRKHKFTNIDKVPRIIRDYLKNRGYNFAELDRLLNQEQINRARKLKNFKEIIKDKNISTPCVFKQGRIDFLREHLSKINKKIKDENIREICGEDIYWDKIKSIEFIGKDETYDLEVPKFHNFISNGIVVHNSAIALNLARKLGKSSIVVPGKNLQNQYKKDYGEEDSEKYLLKENKDRLKINVITGRNNHKCKFLEDNKNAIPRIKTEVNAKLHDIFAKKREEANELIGKDVSADNYNIPCKIEIKEKNIRRIKEYLRQNKKVKVSDFSDIRDIKRMSIAPVCPYWSPVIPDKYEVKTFDNVKERSYKGLKDTNFIFYQRTPGCSFYEQFNSYIDSDVIIFNSLKYKLESALNRKPLTEVEIIDECDEFLDSFANQRTLEIDRLQNSLAYIFTEDEKVEETVREISEIIKQIKRNRDIGKAVETKDILPLKRTGIYDLLKIFLKSPGFLEEIEDESYLFEVEETARMFEDFFEESYLTFHKKENNLIASIVTTNLAKKFKEMIEKNKIIILMSGTIHSENVLKSVFGLEDFKIINAETEHQGKIEVKKTGLEMDCKYSNFSSGKFNRENYLKALSKCIEVAKKPVLIHINAFIDLPSEEEIERFGIKNIISRESLKDMQREDKSGELVRDFKQGHVDILFSTRCARGIDFPGEQCNSIIFTKYPNPNIKDAFWKILAKTNPQQFWDFYRDKAKRELWQKVYRGLRFKEDHIFLLSPDTRVLESFGGR